MRKVLRKKNLFKGSFFILIAAFAYALMGLFVKKGGTYSDSLLVFSRNFICLLVLLPMLFIPKPVPLQTPVFFGHLFRSLAGIANMYCFFFSLRYILLTDAMLLNNTMPLFVPLIEWIVKKKPLKFWMIPGLLLGFTGVILILKPSYHLLDIASLLALASGFFMSISMVGIRELSRIEPTARIMFYYFFLSSIISSIPFFLTIELPSSLGWAIVLGIGVFAAMYQFFLTKGYENAPAAVISPLIYFAVVISIFFDWLIFKQPPTLLGLSGIVLVILGSWICIRTERRS